MKKKSLMIALMSLTGSALTSGLLHAQEVSGSVGVDAVSAYVFRGATVNDEININPTIEVSVSGITIGTWGNFNTDTSQFDETDYYIGYDLPMGDDAPVGVSIGYTEYTFPTATAADDEGVITGGLEADREVSISFSCDCPASPSLGVYYGIEGPFLDQGLYLELGLGHSLELTPESALDLGVAIGYEAGDNVDNNGFSHATFSAGTGLGVASISLNYVLELDKDVLEVDESFYVALGFAL